MKLKTNLLHTDVLKTMNRTKYTQQNLADYLGVSRFTVCNLYKSKDMKVSMFLNIVEWLNKPIKKYIDEA